MSPISAAMASTQLIGHREKQRHVAVVGAELTQLTLALADLAVELVDQAQAGLDRALPRLREVEGAEQLAAADAEEIGDQGLPCVSSTAWTLLRLERWRTRCSRQRARSRSARMRGSGSQIAGTRVTPAKLGEDQASMRSVLQASGASSLQLLRVGDLDSPTRQFEAVVHEPRPVHRFDCRANRRTVTSQTLAQTKQPLDVGRRCADSTVAPSPSRRWKSRRLRLRSKPAYNMSASFDSRGRAEHDSAGGPSSWHSLPSGAVTADTRGHSWSRLSCKSGPHPMSGVPALARTCTG